ncbi:MAG: hypothetical protein ACXAC8_08005 [Candidatus Hodarchaeales archaeon]
MSKENSKKVFQLVNEKKQEIDQSSLKGTNLVVILADEGGLPVYTRSIHIDQKGDVHSQQSQEISPKNEKIVLMSGLLEAIMQLKDVVRPTLTDISVEANKPLYVEHAKAPNGISLVSVSTSPEFQQLPMNLLAHYTPQKADLDRFPEWDEDLEKVIESPLGEDATIYRKILSQIKTDLAEFVSFILVFDSEGNYQFSTAKNQEQNKLSDPLLISISNYIKQEYLLSKYRENLSLIGAKRLHDSVIWHFKCYDKIFVFFTYHIPDLYMDFDILKAEMITFIANNLEKFIDASKTHSEHLNKSTQDIKTTRFIFLS